MASNRTPDNRNSVLRQVRTLIEKQLSGRTARAYLFGSWARSEEKASSDIDVAIEFDQPDPSNRQTLMRIREVFEESTVPYRIDVVNLNEADAAIIDKVKKEGILWDARTNG